MSKRSPFRCFKTSLEFIRLVVMLHVPFPLSPQNAEDLLLDRGIEVSHETVRYWRKRFGQLFASEIRKGLRALTATRPEHKLNRTAALAGMARPRRPISWASRQESETSSTW